MYLQNKHNSVEMSCCVACMSASLGVFNLWPFYMWCFKLDLSVRFLLILYKSLDVSAGVFSWWSVWKHINQLLFLNLAKHVKSCDIMWRSLDVIGMFDCFMSSVVPSYSSRRQIATERLLMAFLTALQLAVTQRPPLYAWRLSPAAPAPPLRTDAGLSSVI